MGVRKSMEEEISVSGSKEEWMGKCFRALDAGGFSNVEQNQTINQLTAGMRGMTCWGDIIVTLHPNFSDSNSPDGLRIHIKSTANYDNIWALLFSPNQKIINSFKNFLK